MPELPAPARACGCQRGGGGVPGLPRPQGGWAPLPLSPVSVTAAAVGSHSSAGSSSRCLPRAGSLELIQQKKEKAQTFSCISKMTKLTAQG